MYVMSTTWPALPWPSSPVWSGARPRPSPSWCAVSWSWSTPPTPPSPCRLRPKFFCPLSPCGRRRGVHSCLRRRRRGWRPRLSPSRAVLSGGSSGRVSPVPHVACSRRRNGSWAESGVTRRSVFKTPIHDSREQRLICDDYGLGLDDEPPSVRMNWPLDLHRSS